MRPIDFARLSAAVLRRCCSSIVAHVIAAGLSGAAIAAEMTLPPDGCRAEATAPWVAAGEGYRAQAATEGPTCGEASLDMALVAPSGRAVWELHFSNVAAVRPLYGVPDAAAMTNELAAWISQAGDPATSADLSAWPSAGPGPVGFEPQPDLTRGSYEALRAGAKPLFCYAEAPGFDTCVALVDAYDVKPIGRRPTR